MSRDVPVEGSGVASALRWAGAGAVVIGLHVGIGALLVGRTMLPPMPDAAQAGLPIDLDPVTVPQDEAAAAPAPPEGRPEAELPPAPQPPVEPPPPEATEPAAPPRVETPPTIEPPPVEPPPVEQQTVEAPARVSEPAPAPPLSPVTLPELPPARDADEATLARPLPPPRPAAPPKPKATKPVSKPVDRQAEAEAREATREQRREAQRQVARQRAAERRAEAAPGAARQGAEAQPRASASAGEVASWRGALMAHLNRFKRPPAGGGAGTARVGFSVDAGGGLSGAHLVASSGDPSLDEAAVAMIARANPVPPPPAGLGSRLSLTIPIRFSGE